MATLNDNKKASALNLLACKCPRCRKGDMFVYKNPYKLKTFMKMHDTCPECGQEFDIEVGFYYGSSYVSYALSIAISVATLVAWWVFSGISLMDNSVIYWLVFNSIFLIALQPVIMRLARTLWLAFFVRYERNWKDKPAEKAERTNNDLKNAW